ncbi:hypothetical protein MAL08_03705 [Leptospira noguchii]|nr:hypothetical protein [Leptospira noguchii]UOG38445.1 hypothetical protein MAL08_03705 [Leptospira noguchii]
MCIGNDAYEASGIEDASHSESDYYAAIRREQHLSLKNSEGIGAKRTQ